MWFALKGYESLTRRCASEGCGGRPTWRLEVDGMASDYCAGCKEKIDNLRPSQVIVREMRDEWPH